MENLEYSPGSKLVVTIYMEHYCSKGNYFCPQTGLTNTDS